MKRVAIPCIILIMGIFLMQCGGAKKLSPEEYQNLSNSERIAYLTKQVEKSPNDMGLKKMLYEEYMDADMRPQAIQTLGEILELDPYQVDLQYKYGQLNHEEGNTREAYQAFLRVMQSGSAEIYKDQVAQYVAGNFLTQQVTFDGEDEAFPSFSPDGSKIIYQKRNNGNWDIYEYTMQTKTARPVVASEADEELPTYNPQGTQIAFTSNSADRRPIGSNYKVREITLLETSDNFTSNVTQSVADDWLPRYSHSGTQLLFVSERNDLRKVNYLGKQSDLFVMNSNGDFQHRLTETPVNEGGACFSANDKQIYFHSNQNGNYDIFVMRTDGSQKMTVVNNPNGDDVNPHASPVADYITFVSNRDGNYEIYRCRANGGEQERLTIHPGVDSNPTFSPDGQTIAFHSNRNGNFDIFFINLGHSTSGTTIGELIDRLNGLLQ